MNTIIHQALSSLSLAGRLPVVLKEEADFSRLSFFLPLIGLPAAVCAMTGLLLGSWLFGPGLLAVLLSVACQYLAFNLFHFDGLLDTADAAGVFGDTAKRRSVLKDSRIGVFAFFAGFIFLLARLETARLVLLHTAGLGDIRLLWAIFLLAPVSGRLAGIFVSTGNQPADSSGLAALVGPLSGFQAATGYCLAASPAFVLLAVSQGALMAIAGFIGAALLAIFVGLAVGLWYRRAVGGYTGDAIGAAIELGELAILVAATVLLH